MLTFLSIQGSYQTLEIALWQKASLAPVSKQITRQVSSQFIPLIQLMLNDAGLTLTDLDFIAVDHGPGAFISLRVAIATVNGIAYVQNTPLIGINGLDALAHEALKVAQQTSYPQQPAALVCMLNAYGQDVYCLITDMQGKEQMRGCFKIDELLGNLTQTYAQQALVFAGNAVALYRDAITQQGHEQWYIDQNLPTLACATQLGLMARERWEEKQFTPGPLTPNYMKTQLFAVRSQKTT